MLPRYLTWWTVRGALGLAAMVLIPLSLAIFWITK